MSHDLEGEDLHILYKTPVLELVNVLQQMYTEYKLCTCTIYMKL